MRINRTLWIRARPVANGGGSCANVRAGPGLNERPDYPIEWSMITKGHTPLGALRWCPAVEALWPWWADSLRWHTAVRMDNLQPAPDCQALAISTGAIGSLHTAPSAWVTRARGVGYRSARLSSGIPLSRMCAWSGRRCMARPRQCGWRAAWSVLTVLYHTRSHSRSTVR
jgi:hypothetical protein